MPRATGWKALENEIVSCTRCPRLRTYCRNVAREKKREFREEEYWGRPVPGFGDHSARVWIFGLAPAAHGANRTGRMFTGDSSGNWLYKALYETGFANQPTSVHVEDGLKLTDVYISASARCAPPDNKPTKEEIENCSTYLDAEWSLLKRKKIFVALGAIGYDSLWKLLKAKGVALPKGKPKFKHGLVVPLGEYEIRASYHPSRQNTNTGLLTWPMWVGLFKGIRQALAP